MMQGPRPEEIKSIFTSVAAGYDRANDAMTFGMARSWRRKTVAWSGAQRGDHVLDCATGTGDLALEFKRAVGPQGHVTGTDFCESMLDKAPPKAKALGLNVDFSLADVTQLPFSDNQFDIASIAYGIRNVSDPAKALREMARVVKPGGRVMILETGDTPSTGLKLAMQFYIRQVVPRLGGWITGQRGAYEYLNRSSRGFPSRERFVDLMNSTHAFKTCEYRTLMGGASFIYRGVVA
ncbi:MAG: bifunctional demethylmenaquinone methyltransferase/2-methoxy-6-polyprenyl-1,4-benzoquinol methylase UbiE [Bdellovibrionales bacterium]|nr:bifunctional demethylmenaquinone methyltransferase/2-methoxy-6-polyprenyl-1,4-benzoquinol methylase UbiE [Bdellovibrionales bacterium]